MKILILTGRFGMGHVSAAKALQQEFEKDPYAETKVIDIVEHMLPNMHKRIYKSFDKIAEKYPTIYNRAYQTSESNFDLSFSRFFLKKFYRLLKEEEPDLIVSTLHLATKLTSNYKKKKNIDIPLVTCITDISSSEEWLTEQTDLYLVATEDVKAELIKKHIAKENIIVSGIPVRQEFKQGNNNIDDKDENNLLIMGGGLGLLPKSMDFYKRLDKLPNTKTTIIAGNNKDIFDKLFNLFHNIEVIGYSNEVHKHMQKADAMFSKAGGITLFETIHAELPIIVPRPFLAQEVNNAKYIEENSLGKVVWDDEEDLVSAIEDMFANKAERKKIKQNMKHIKESIIDSPLNYITGFMKVKEVAL